MNGAEQWGIERVKAGQQPHSGRRRPCLLFGGPRTGLSENGLAAEQSGQLGADTFNMRCCGWTSGQNRLWTAEGGEQTLNQSRA